jgi:Metallo-peptidase family M12B Reprolysin-like
VTTIMLRRSLGSALFLLIAACLCLPPRSAVAQLTSCATGTVCYYINVQPIDVCNNDGSGCAPYNTVSQIGNPTAAITCSNPIGFCDATAGKDITRAMWNKVGVDIAWQPMQQYLSTASQTLQVISCSSDGSGCVSSGFATLTQQNCDAMLYPPGSPCLASGSTPTSPLNLLPNVLNMFFIDTINPPPGFSGTLYGLAWVGANGIAISSNVFFPPLKLGPRYDTLGHEIGHNLGLNHADAYNYDCPNRTCAPAADLMTTGSSRTEPTSTSNALTELDGGLGQGTADQVDCYPASSTTVCTFAALKNDSTPQQGEVGTSGFLTTNPIQQTTTTTTTSTTTSGGGGGGGKKAATTTGPSPFDNLNSSTCQATFTVSHADNSGRAFENMIEVDFTPPLGWQFLGKTFTKANNSVDYKQSVNASGTLVLLMPAPPNQFPTWDSSGTSQLDSFQFSIGISSATASCPANLAGMLGTYKFSDGFVTTSRFAPDGSGNATAGTGTPALDKPATIDPTLIKSYTVIPNALPCSPNTQTGTDQQLPNGCPNPSKLGIADADPLTEGGQIWQSAAIRSCKPSGALATLIQNRNAGSGSVTAYVPNGSWSTTNTGVQVLQIEPATSPALLAAIPTTDVINSCASNSVTGQTICTANNANVYLLSGTRVAQSVSSGATGTAQFSGGFCQNCGVAINQTTNTAAITMGLSSAASGTGLQFLDLGTGNFATPVPAVNQIAEGIVWDAGRNLLLSPSELNLNIGNSGIFDLFDTSALPSVPEYANTVSEGGGNVELDSAAEDCTTGIALATNELQKKLYIADLTQLQKTTGAPTGTWSVGTAQNFPVLAGVSDNSPPVTGIAVAPGSHLAVVASEFGGNQFSILQLPATSGMGTPALVDQVAAGLPLTPDGVPWSQGFDPHAVTAYVSPNDGKAYAVLANAPFCSSTSSYLAPSFLAVIDMAGVLAAPRTGNNVNYDLVGNGIVRYVATGAPGCPPIP